MKTKRKPPLKSENVLQEYAVQKLYEIDRNIPIIANPHSSIRNMGNKHMTKSQRAAYFHKTKTQNKKRGFQEGQSDLIAICPKGYLNGLAIELKTLPEDPFRSFYGRRGTVWIQETSDFEKAGHIIKQLSFIEKMTKMGFLGFVCAGKDQFDAIFNYYFHHKHIKDSGFETKSYTFMDKYYETRTISYLSKI